MLKQPIYYEFNLDAKTSPSKLIAISHVDDKYSEVIEVAVKQNDRFVYMGGATVIARMVLHRDKDYLLSDDVPCTVNTNGNILIPFDNAVVKTLKGIVKIEVSITRDTDELTLQFPLWVSVNGSILDDAEVTPESEGTIPDLLKEAADALEDAEEALERLGSYSNLSDKPQINGVTLNGNKTPAELGLQKTLTAGAHISINQADGVIEGFEVAGYKIVFESQNDRCNEDGTIYSTSIDGQPAVMFVRNSTTHITQFALVKGGQLIWRYQQAETSWQPAGEWSAWEEIGGTDDYNDLSNKPQINGHVLNGNLNFSELGISNVTLRAYNPPFWVSSLNAYNVGDIWVNDSTKISFILKSKDGHNLTWAKLGVQSYVSDTTPPAFEILHDKHLLYSAGDIWIHRELHNSGSIRPRYNLLGLYVCVGSVSQNTDPYNQYNITWQRIDNKVLSGVVNQNGTITFTNSDGSTFTTSGASVIGPQGDPGDDYVLTAQDKADIADIVLQVVPTTQWVLYGNTSN